MRPAPSFRLGGACSDCGTPKALSKVTATWKERYGDAPPTDTRCGHCGKSHLTERCPDKISRASWARFLERSRRRGARKRWYRSVA